MYGSECHRKVAAEVGRSAGRPPLGMSKRRKVRSVTLDPIVIQEFVSWTDKNALSFSRGVEEAMRAWMEGGRNDADI